jgi:hypothetical protein
MAWQVSHRVTANILKQVCTTTRGHRVWTTVRDDISDAQSGIGVIDRPK